ncbi:hypothetical protein N9K67_04635, partial [Opitutaceae bacterium]|nr:hypothetical protein [Opitutaceae bacterium]
MRENNEAVSDEFIDTAIQMMGAQAKDVEFPPIAGGQSLPPFAFGQSAPAPAPTPEPAAAAAAPKAPTHNLVAKPEAEPTIKPGEDPVAEPIAKPVTKPSAKKLKLPRQWVLGAAGLVVLAGGVIWWSQGEGTADPEIAQTPAVATTPETTSDEFDPTVYSDEQLWADYEAHRKARRYEQAAERLEPLTTRNTDLSTTRSLEL